MLYFTQIIYKAGVSEDRIAVLITPAKNKGGSYKWQKRENFMECETITCLVMRRDSAKLGGALMTNAVLQKNEEVLRNLLATLLEMDEADIVDCHLENPIELGKEIEGKECILDVKLTLNNAKIINIELQVYKQTYWVERSLLYWARAFDNLKSGEDYSKLLPTYHIGILDFTLFEDHPKFMAQYQIMDVEDQFLYSDKLCIKVLDLTQLDAAKKQANINKKLVKWASIFKAETLEELEQLANGEEVFEKMVVTMKKLSEDEKIRMQCEAREDYERCLLSEFNAGKREGEEIGEQRGRAMGEEIGEKRGKDETEKKLVQHLMQSMKLSETDAKKMLGL